MVPASYHHPHPKSCQEASVTLRDTSSLSPRPGKPISHSPAVIYLDKVRGKRTVLSKKKLAYVYIYSLFCVGSGTFLSMYLSLRGEKKNPYWWQDLMVWIACDNFFFRHSPKAKCVKALEMRKGDYSQAGWPTVPIGVSKCCSPNSTLRKGEASPSSGHFLVLRWVSAGCRIHLFPGFSVVFPLWKVIT